MDCLNHWIPACAGMTEVAKIKAIKLPVCVYRFIVIPAKAGIHACIPVSGPAPGGYGHILGGLFPTPLYHLHPCRRVHK